MSGRDAILGAISRQVGGKSNDVIRRAAVANRIAQAPKGIIPERGQLPARQRLDLFCEKAESVTTTTARVKSYDELPAAVSDYLRGRNLPQSICLGADERLAKADWSNAPVLETRYGPTSGDDAVGLSHAASGVAETGTLILSSGKDNPTTINFLPETHIIVVAASSIEGDYETALDGLRQEFGKGRMPRTVNMITGPSRSGDIEQTIILGAHGPRSLHVLVVDDLPV